MNQIQTVTDIYIMNLGICVVSLFIVFLSFVLLWTGRRMDPKTTRYLFNIVVSNLLLNISYVLVAYYQLRAVHDNRFIFMAGVLGEYIFASAICYILGLYLIYLIEQKGFHVDNIRRWIRYLFAAMLIPMIINLKIPFLYVFDADNVYCERWPMWLYRSLSFILFAIVVYVIQQYEHALEREVIFSTFLILLVITLSGILCGVFPSVDIMGFGLSLSIFVMILYVEDGMITRYMKDEKRLLRVKTSLLLYQMRPHFLYNALSSISQLCKQDSKKAATMTKCFSEYLSKNLSDLVKSKPVPFEKEIHYIKSYLKIEKMRFGETLKVVYNINETDFVIPPMVIQPILENSIKHGIGVREEGGTIYISSRVCEDGHVITLSDNGVGFDLKTNRTKENADKRVHLGMTNARKQIKKIPGADFIVKSIPGKGTITIIVIPKKYSEKYMKMMKNAEPDKFII